MCCQVESVTRSFPCECTIVLCARQSDFHSLYREHINPNRSSIAAAERIQNKQKHARKLTMTRTEPGRYTPPSDVTSWVADDWPRLPGSRCGNGRIYDLLQGGNQGGRPACINNLPISESAKQALWEYELQKIDERYGGRSTTGGVRWPDVRWPEGCIRRKPWHEFSPTRSID